MRHIPLCLVVPFVLACGDPLSPEDVAGVYNLESVNGIPLPAEIEIPGVMGPVVFTAGSVTLNADGTFSASTTGEITEDGITTTETYTDSGTFTLVEPSTIRFSEAGGSESSGTLDGGILTLSGNEVYRKQG